MNEGRTVFIHNAKGNNEALGGLYITQGITKKNLYDMLEILLVFESPYTIALAGGDTVPKDGAELRDLAYTMSTVSPQLLHSRSSFADL